jgi:hypothetical protein
MFRRYFVPQMSVGHKISYYNTVWGNAQVVFAGGEGGLLSPYPKSDDFS